LNGRLPARFALTHASSAAQHRGVGKRDYVYAFGYIKGARMLPLESATPAPQQATCLPGQGHRPIGSSKAVQSFDTN
jgi:hypothetical protein